MTLFQHAKATASLSVIGCNLILFCVPLVLLALAKLARPRSERIRHGMETLYRTAVAVDDAWLKNVAGTRWTAPTLALPHDRNCMVVCNHVSWADIFLVQSLIARNGPVVKFLCKRSLVWLPMIGIVAWAFGFPLVRRNAKRPEDEAARRADDIARVREACAVLRGAPSAMLTFAEGTRITEEKHRRLGSSYAHLLPPRVGGFSAIYESLRGAEFSVVDVTLVFPPGATFWRFLGGAAGVVDVRAAAFDGAELAEADLGDWLRARWRAKDRVLAEVRTSVGEGVATRRDRRIQI